ncbi:hypothetical protein [Parvularcula sp. IMCC14364]|uniref:hypothetical protein n=1 Tax=Parvularcula sp. IMCC14364 TaxID=3067902 RepID=UPI0027409F37|nr:hypothetical protein [Parvularcula sp. IMCC14364]
MRSSINREDNPVSRELLNSAAEGSALAALISLLGVACIYAALYHQAVTVTAIIWAGAAFSVAGASLIVSSFEYKGARLFSIPVQQLLSLRA